MPAKKQAVKSPRKPRPTKEQKRITQLEAEATKLRMDNSTLQYYKEQAQEKLQKETEKRTNVERENGNLNLQYNALIDGLRDLHLNVRDFGQPHSGPTHRPDPRGNGVIAIPQRVPVTPERMIGIIEGILKELSKRHPPPPYFNSATIQIDKIY